MTIKNLIDQLSEFRPSADVLIAVDIRGYGFAYQDIDDVADIGEGNIAIFSKPPSLEDGVLLSLKPN